VRALYLLLILISCTNVHSKELGPCHPSNIFGEVTRFEKVGNKLNEKKSWHQLPRELSLHTGEFGRLKFKTGSNLQISYIGKSYKKILKKKLSKSHIADINFVNWFDNAHSFKGGTLKFELLKLEDDKLKVICTHNMEITGGD